MTQPETPPREGETERTLPSEFYTSAEIFALEKERIFSREWVCVGRESDLPGPGDSLVVDVAGESIVVLRNEDGQLRAFYNVCRHRGAQLCGTNLPGKVAPAGVVGGKRIRCAYHSWTYSLDGELVAAPHLSGADGIDRSKYSLYPVGADAWAGFAFVNLTPEGAPSLAAQLGIIPRRIARYPLDRLRAGHTIRYDVAANWKVIAENYNECYHCGGAHPELCSVVPAFRQNGGAGLDWDSGIPHRDGAYTFTMTGTTDRAPFPGLDEDEKTRHKGELVYPNLFLSLSCDHAAAFILHPKGPDRTIIDCLFLFAPEEIARNSFDPSDAVEFWDITNRQDWAICESVQRGIASRPHRYGHYAPMEDMSLDIRRYVGERLGLPGT
ncbi:MAG TPA: aromatic ring-hydroxylating dioxygenase subunit alpha [Stellaceae bacterium]|nr:aromatic ring-hydroxylating dioxygenase subunit alpha [Stellaceae bacterium]